MSDPDSPQSPVAHHAGYELPVCLGIATAIVLLQAVIPLTYEQYFDSDQAVYGLMAKHLSEFRAFPLFFYGQNYMLGVQSWLAVPFFWLGGPTVTMLRLPIILLNVSVATGFVWFLTRWGLRPWMALVAALPVVAFTPVKAIEFGAVYGAGIEPFGYALVLWLLRHRPLAFGAVLGFGTLHREFTFLAVPALAVAGWRDPRVRSAMSIGWRVAGFALVWLVVDFIKRHVNILGPAGGTFEAGSVALGAKTFVSWLSFDWVAYATRTWEIVSWGIPDMLGIHPYRLRDYSVPSDMVAGSRLAAIALGCAVIGAVGRTLWLSRHTAGRGTPAPSSVGAYLAALAVWNVLVYGLNGGTPVGDTPILRYALYAPLLLIALLATYFARERSANWRVLVAAAVVCWAGANVTDNVRLIQDVARHPPPRAHRQLVNHLEAHRIKYARADYWDAYVLTFLSQERIIVASTTTVRISAYQAAVDAHASEAVTLPRQPCEGGPMVAAWCVVPPSR